MYPIGTAGRRFLLSLGILLCSVSVARALPAEPTADWWCYNEWCCKWIDYSGGDDYDTVVQESCTSCPSTDGGWQGTSGVRPGACY